MKDFVNLTALVCAAFASMGFGVLAAYAVCKAGFALMRWHTGQISPKPVVAATRPAEAS